MQYISVLNKDSFVNGSALNIHQLPECESVKKRGVMTKPLDIVFVMDTTYSMSKVIPLAKDAVFNIINAV